MMSEVDVCG